jgi:UDP-N-acetylmuramate dehydrogenase
MILPSGLVVERDFALAPLTSWLVGGHADYLVQPRTVEDLRESVQWAEQQGLPLTLLGGGTNVLVADNGVRGLTIALRKMAKLELEVVDGWVRITCLAGTSKSELLKNFLKQKLEPALFLAGLPGDVGGGVVMNAGIGEKIQPREFVEITDWVEVMRLPGGEIERIDASSLDWNYRHCDGWQPGIVTRVGIKWKHEPKDDILARVKEANRVRLSKQPLDLPSCGSVFRNPLPQTSGQLVESCGLKGFAVGGAKVSEKHANFIVNFHESTALDIHRVIEHVKATVLAQKGIQLRTEVVYVGDWSGIRSDENSAQAKV